MAQFRDLPKEVINTIVSYVPIEVFEKLFDIPFLGMFAQKEVNSTVVISDLSKCDEEPVVYSDQKLYVKNTIEYLNLLRSEPNLVPKRIIFKNPFDALALTNHSNAIKPGFYIHEYLQRPFYVDAIHTVYGNNFEHYLCPTLTQNVKSLTLSGTDPIDFTSISQVFFPHLSFLQIEQQLDAEEFRSLPRNLKAFVGNMKNTNASQMKLEFPETLNKLHLKVDSMHGDVMCQFDISHLTKLHDARIEPSTVVIGFRGEHTPLLGSWNLPNSLQKLWIYYNRMIIGKLETIGSSITELEIHCHYEGDDNDFIQDLSIPESVKVLAIPSSFLSSTGRSITLKFLKDHPQLRYRVKFPDGLMKLKLTGNSDIRRTLVLDFYVHKFPNLEELILWLPGHVNAIGKFPKRIKKIHA
ncbi:hypothetical protein K6H09_002462 [Candida tropicalis]